MDETRVPALCARIAFLESGGLGGLLVPADSAEKGTPQGRWRHFGQRPATSPEVLPAGCPRGSETLRS